MICLDGNDIIRAPTLPASGGLRRRHSLPSGCCTATLLKHASLTDQDDAANNNSQDCYQDSVVSSEPRDQNSGPSRRNPGQSVATDAGSSTCLIDPDSSSSSNNDSSGSSSSHPLMLEEAPAGATAAKGAQAGWFRNFGISRAGRAGAPTAAAASASREATAASSGATAAPGAQGNDGSSDEPADGVVHAFAAAGGAQGASAKVAAQIPQAASAAVDQIMSRMKPASRPRTKSE